MKNKTKDTIMNSEKYMGWLLIAYLLITVAIFILYFLLNMRILADAMVIGLFATIGITTTFVIAGYTTIVACICTILTMPLGSMVGYFIVMATPQYI